MKNFELPPLPFAQDALHPHISANTLSFHYGKHHRAYVDNLNKLRMGTKFEEAGLEDIIRKADGPLYNNAAQVWNHTFYWNCLSPQGGGKPTGELLSAIEETFGSFDEFKAKFSAAAASLFGSGWVWLVCDKKDNLEILSTPNAGNPIREGKDPLLVIDVWEHAYYLDYQNKRADYIAHFFDLINWKAVEERF